jgi:hypothetical protein
MEYLTAMKWEKDYNFQKLDKVTKLNIKEQDEL